MELSELQKSNLFENLPRYNVIVDGDERIICAEPGFKRALHAGSRNLAGRPLSKFIYHEDYERFAAVFEELRTDSGPDAAEEIEFRAQAFGGEWSVLEAAVQRLPGESQGEFVLSVKDITDEKTQLRELQDENERLQEFAKMVSHDIRTPLQIAQGHVEQASETGNEDSFDKIRQSHERIETIVSDMLNLAQNGSPMDGSEPISLAETAHAAWDSIDTKEMELVIRDDSQIEAHPDRLQQLFENLFRNTAEHAGPSSTVVVGPLDPMATSTRTKEQLQSGFFVSDDGPGIPDDLKETVFESGFTTSTDGTGFGLAIVKQIAEVARWETNLKDAYVGGSRFEFIEVPETEWLGPNG